MAPHTWSGARAQERLVQHRGMLVPRTRKNAARLKYPRSSSWQHGNRWDVNNDREGVCSGVPVSGVGFGGDGSVIAVTFYDKWTSNRVKTPD